MRSVCAAACCRWLYVLPRVRVAGAMLPKAATNEIRATGEIVVTWQVCIAHLAVAQDTPRVCLPRATQNLQSIVSAMADAPTRTSPDEDSVVPLGEDQQADECQGSPGRD